MLDVCYHVHDQTQALQTPLHAKMHTGHLQPQQSTAARLTESQKTRAGPRKELVQHRQSSTAI